jgi:hypothetical protein
MVAMAASDGRQSNHQPHDRSILRRSAAKADPSPVILALATNLALESESRLTLHLRISLLPFTNLVAAETEALSMEFS